MFYIINCNIILVNTLPCYHQDLIDRLINYNKAVKNCKQYYKVK